MEWCSQLPGRGLAAAVGARKRSTRGFDHVCCWWADCTALTGRAASHVPERRENMCKMGTTLVEFQLYRQSYDATEMANLYGPRTRLLGRIGARDSLRAAIKAIYAAVQIIAYSTSTEVSGMHLSCLLLFPISYFWRSSEFFRVDNACASGPHARPGRRRACHGCKLHVFLVSLSATQLGTRIYTYLRILQ